MCVKGPHINKLLSLEIKSLDECWMKKIMDLNDAYGLSVPCNFWYLLLIFILR
jgi:hypothetical protein